MTGGGFLSVGDDSHDDAQQWRGVARVLGPNWAKMPLSTIGLIGLQIVWSVEMSNAPAYLLTLGMSRAGMSIVFLAGPLSGLIVQPIVGAMADASTSRFGRRRPYIMGGAIICGFAMLLLGFTRQFAGIVTPIPSAVNDSLTIALAVFAIYCIDFAVNAVQAADRAILVDVWPREEQERGNAWAARMGGVGSILGFFVGNVDVTSTFPLFGRTQLQILSVLSALTLIGFHLLTSCAVKERVLVASPASKRASKNPLRTIWRDITHLPRVIKQICMIQFFVWIAWFPILFYSSVYVGDIYKRNSGLPPSQQLEDEATRQGSRALFYNSVVSFAATVLLPFCIFDETRDRMGGLGWRKPTLAELWTMSQFVFSACMAATWWTTSVWGAQVIMATLGLCSAVAQWAPFSLLGQAILAEGNSRSTEGDDIALADRRSRTAPYEAVPLNGAGATSPHLRKSQSYDGNMSDDDNDGPRTPRTPLGSNPLAQQSHAHIAGDAEDGVGHSYQRPRSGGGIGDKGGSILGIHNIFVVVPQFLVSGLSSLIFAFFEPEKTTPHPGVADVPIKGVNGTLPKAAALFRRDPEFAQSGSDALGLIFRIGGVSAIFAGVLCWRLAKELRRR
ncbi:MFS general substrate transporter [Auricularia subglabra TFB-10046 SS5]|nr:MFS general substrate transporter [Auricularia subglabra TFB-10046 SS5]